MAIKRSPAAHTERNSTPRMALVALLAVASSACSDARNDVSAVGDTPAERDSSPRTGDAGSADQADAGPGADPGPGPDPVDPTPASPELDAPTPEPAPTAPEPAPEGDPPADPAPTAGEPSEPSTPSADPVAPSVDDPTATSCEPEPGLCACFESGPCLELQYVQWGGVNAALAASPVFDADGNLYVAAPDANGLDIAGATTSARGNVVRFTPDGTPDRVLVWPDLYITIRALGMASDGSLYAAGAASEGEERGMQAFDAFLRKTDLAGNELWQVKWGGDLEEEVEGLGLDANGNVYVAGYTRSELVAGMAVGEADGFVTQWSAAGEQQWTTQFGGTGLEIVHEIAVAPDGTSYTVGESEDGVAEADPGANGEGFVVKLNAAGQEQWRRQFGAEAEAGAQTVALTPGGVIVGGSIKTEDDFDAVLLAYDSDGEVSWQQTFGDPSGNQVAMSIALSAQGRVFVAMRSSGDLPSALSDSPDRSNSALVLTEWTLDGQFLWAYEFGTDSFDSPLDLALAPDGRIVYTGGTQAGLPGYEYQSSFVKPFVSWIRLYE